MNANDLFKSFEALDDDTLIKSEAKKKNGGNLIRWAAAAAAVLALGVGVFTVSRLVKKPDGRIDALVPTAVPTATPLETQSAYPTQPAVIETNSPNEAALSIRLLSASSKIPADRQNSVPRANETEMRFGATSFTRDKAAGTLTVSFEGTEYTGSYTCSRYDYNSYVTDFYDCGGGIGFGVNADTGELVYLDLLTPELLAGESDPILDGERRTIARRLLKKLIDSDYHSGYYVDEPEQLVDGVYELNFVHRLDHSDTTSYVTIRLTGSGKLASFRVGDIKAYPAIERETERYLQDADIKFMIHEAMRDLFNEHGVEYPEDWFAHTLLSLTAEGKVALYVFMDTPIVIGGDELETGFLLMLPDVSEVSWYWEVVSMVRDAAGCLIFGDELPESTETPAETPNLFTEAWNEANEQQRAKLEELWNRNAAPETYVREILIIMGELPEDTPRLTLDGAREILDDMDPADYPDMVSFHEEVVWRFSLVAGAPDERFGSGVEYANFWLDDSETEHIGVMLGSVLYYDGQGNYTILKEYAVPDPAIPDDCIPHVVVFNSAEEYRAFAESAELDDAALTEFLSAHSYDMNGVNTRDDVMKVLNELDSLPFLKLEGFRLETVHLRGYIGEATVLYRSESSDDVVIGFDFMIKESDDTAEEMAEDFGSETAPIDAEGIPGMKFLLRLTGSEWADTDAAYYITNIRSHSAQIVTTGMSEETLLDILYGCGYGTIDECF